MNLFDRRRFLQLAGLAGSASIAGTGIAQTASENIRHEVLGPNANVAPPKHTIRFAVIGLDHGHIMSMTAAVLRGGGQLVSVLSTNREGLKEKQLAEFRARFGDIPEAPGEDAILQDRSIQLVIAAPVPDERASLGIRVMKAEKDFLSDKPAITSLAQLAAVRKTIRETKRKFAVMYSERLEVPAAVKAGELVQAGAIGKVIQTVNLAPHRLRASSRPGWFFDKKRYGGILTDIGSHQADQFLFYTGSTKATVVASQTGNLAHPAYPDFEDFGDMMLTGNGGTGYVRVDWFTPDGLATWGDGRLFILGTEGYIELRKYIDPVGRPGANHLLIVDRKEALHLDCSKLDLPFGREFVADIVNRTETAQNQEQALLAAELVLKAQKNATRPIVV
ncbi:Gfo/Idh/MocA family oxidoreductase [Massilia terrae]|uniref:Gfo/Idh/MocA family oxidoreductase n=1 Tax=Massilia terrae TaxID=1811224 RepID=A0ABT2D2N8_9BURK|nr:Gfo/Idh/MocA family oxidoreductase [Massilia terrae]MCS0659603.1 Gfo/Idh/MocA family oxidoreductase [Massilia terrae]